MNLGGEGCSELRSSHCTLEWATKVKLYLKKKMQNNIVNEYVYSFCIKKRKERKSERKEKKR